MIKNDLQYRVAKSSLKELQASLEKHNELTADQEKWVREAHRATIFGEIKKLKASIREYERIKSGEEAPPPLDLIAEIPTMLIKRRIALGWSQEDLAKQLGVRVQQVQNDEATNYESASLSRLLRIAQTLQQARKKRKKATG
ncbi:helix-turn-helix domain-containing protein [bacterium]|nr:helix-turn-helix domain-containing protein [bacterium]